MGRTLVVNGRNQVGSLLQHRGHIVSLIRSEDQFVTHRALHYRGRRANFDNVTDDDDLDAGMGNLPRGKVECPLALPLRTLRARLL